MFGFGKTTSDPLSDARAVQRWLAALPEQDPLAIHAALLTELGRIADRDARRAPAQLEAVFALDAQTADLRRTLTGQYIEHASRSSRIENQLWSALFDLTQAFLVAYQAFGRDLSVHAGSGKWQQMLPELIARQVKHLGCDAKIRLYRYEPWIPAKWSELHTLFGLALSRKLERANLALDASGTTTTIEHEYLLVLVLQLVHGGNTTPKHLEYVGDELDGWCQPLHLTLEPTVLSSFYVDLAGREGLKRRTPGPLEGRVLFLDTRPLHSVLLQNIVVLEQKLRTQPLSDRTPKRNEQLALLQKLAAQADPEFRPFARRGERTAAAGTVDAIVGFVNLAAFLREEERNPVARAEAGQNYGGTMELATFGRMRNESDRIAEQARRRLASHTTPGGPWEVKDVSQTGFRLIAPMIVANAVTLGTVVGLRPHGQKEWTIGIVRRMRRLTSDRAEIGLQVIANQVVGVELVEQRRAAEADYSVNGEATTVNGRTFPGLYLGLRKRGSDTVIQSLILPAPEYQPARKVKLLAAKTSTRLRLGRLLEQQPEWVWAAIEPIDGETALPAAPASA
jgi:hypothetical protein